MEPLSTNPIPALSRRRLLQGGLGVVGAAALVACTPGKAKTVPPTVTTTIKKTDHDRLALRTATSIEFMAVAVYKQLIDTKVITSPNLLDVAQLFMLQHQNHGDFLVAETKKRGGDAYDKPNSVLLQTVTAQLAQAKDERAALGVLVGVERMAAATYQAGVGTYDDVTLNDVTMSVGGIEARHVAVLNGAIGQPQAKDAFGSTTGAVSAGTGLG